MGNCALTFRIVIRNQKSDSHHFDTDWLHVVWFTGGPDNPAAVKQTFPLLNTQDSFQLHTGDVLQPVTLFCSANDADPVMAVFAITNLGSIDPRDQINQATQITDAIAQKAADAYLTAARMILEAIATDTPQISWIGYLSENLLDPHWSDFLTVVNGAIDSVFNNVIGPALNWLAGTFQNLIGQPNCNGEVMHDIAVFVPNNNNDGSLARIYTGPQDNSACGSPPHTEVDLTLHRDFQLIGDFGPVVQPNPNDLAAGEFRNRAQFAAQEGYVGGFPNFYYGMNGQAHVGGTIFIKPSCGEWADIPWSELGYPPLEDFVARMRATDIYATHHGFAGGFPNFFQAERFTGMVGAPSSVAGALVSSATGSATPFVSATAALRSPFLGSPRPNATINVCGTVLIKMGCAVRRQIPIVGLPDQSNIGAVFRAVQDYAGANGFVGGFPTFNHAFRIDIIPGRGPSPASMWIVLLPAEAAVWQDVVLYWNPS